MSIIDYVASKKIGCQVQLLIGQEVYLRLSQEDFLASWDMLYQACSWATAFQSKGFVTSWYHVYQNKYTPLLITAYDNGELIGLLPLALFGKNKKIVGAGKLDAEYQSWLAQDHRSEEFIQKALIILTKQYPKSEIELRFVPGNTPLQGILSDKVGKHRVLLRKRRRPLMLLHAESISTELRKKNRREKINRLKRLGELSFERVIDPHEFSRLFDTIAEQYDFRQASKYNRTYFKANPLRKVFLLELFAQNLLHVTVLKLNNEVIAANVAVAGSNWVHLKGMNTWSPFYARYSPGILQFLMLAQQLSTEAYQVFDLTPGDDPYKEILATDHDDVYELWIYGNYKSYVKNLFRRELYFKVLKRFGTTPLMFEVELKKRYLQFKALLRGRHQRLIKASLPGPVKSSSVTDVYEIDQTLLKAPSLQFAIKKDSLKDMLCYEPQGDKIRCDFLTDALKKYENGEHSYTIAENGLLLFCSWLKKQEEAASPTGSIRMYDFYCHPRHTNNLSVFLENALQAAVNDAKYEKLDVAVSSSDYMLTEAVKTFGEKVIL